MHCFKKGSATFPWDFQHFAPLSVQASRAGIGLYKRVPWECETGNLPGVALWTTEPFEQQLKHWGRCCAQGITSILLGERLTASWSQKGSLDQVRLILK